MGIPCEKMDSRRFQMNFPGSSLWKGDSKWHDLGWLGATTPGEGSGQWTALSREEGAVPGGARWIDLSG